MRLRVATTLAVTIAASFSLFAQTKDDFEQDFELALRRISATYAYFDRKATNWSEMSTLYSANVGNVTNRDEFVTLLEHVIDELYDPHAQLTTNLQNSPRLVPSGTDLWAEWRSGQATITQVRAESDAERAGLKANTVVLALDGIPIAEAVQARMGRSYPQTTAAAQDWALRAVLAGRHNTRRVLQTQQAGERRTVELPAADQFVNSTAPVTSSQIRPGVGYVRFNDSLGDNATISAFDRALAELRDTQGLIVDLRNTPGGGNTGVARAILGRFVTADQPYQKHELPSEERAMGVRRSWLELVSPRGPFTYSRPVVVLVNRWTGSMGEGLAIAFDATRSGTVVGTAMAGLLGATSRIMLPRTGIGINVPTERLYHVNGTPREDFVPNVRVDVTRAEAGEDPFIVAALSVLPGR